MKKIGHLLLISFLLVNICLNGLTVPSNGGDVKASEKVITYINDDWSVTDAEVRTNETIILTGNLTIHSGGTLTFHNVTLRMNCSYDGQYHIEVLSDGEFYIYDNDNDNTTMEDASNITANNTSYRYLFWIRSDSIVKMENSEIHYCGYDAPNWDGNGLYIESDNVTIESSLITSGGKAGVLVFYSSPLISNCTITSNPSWNIVCRYSSPIIVGNTITEGYIGIAIHDFSNPLIKNNNIYSNYDDGIAIGFSSNPIIINTTIEGDNYGVASIGGSSSYPVIINSTLRGYNICDLSLSMSYIVLINTTFNKTRTIFYSSATDANLTVKWYTNIHVKDILDNPIPFTNVVIENKTGVEVYNGTTDASGYCKWIPLTEYVQFDLNGDNDGEDPGEKVFCSPYNITVIKEGYTTGYANVTMNEGKEIIITLEKQPDATPPTIIDHSPINENVPVSTNISVMFNESMNQTSVENAFIVSPNVDGGFGWDDNTMIFTPANPLFYNETYNVTITTDTMDVAGNHLENNYSWEFTTEKKKVNHAPEIDYWHPSIDPVINETENITFNITATDIDNNNLTYCWYINGSLLSGEINNSYTFVSNYSSSDVYEIKVIVIDDGTPSLSDNHSWVLTVLNKNRLPVLEVIGNQTVYEGQLFTLQVNASDPDNDILAFSDNSTLFDINITTGLISFTPNYDSAGIYWVNITVSDGADVIWRAFKLTVINVNRKPTATISSPLDNAKFTTKDTILFDATDSSDPDNDDLTYSWVSSVDGSIGSTASFNRKLSKGTHTITLTIDDGHNGMDTKQITITVKKPSEPSGGFIPGFETVTLLALVCLILAVIIILSRKRKT